MDTLPTEILTDVLTIALQDTKPTHILCTSSLFRSIAERILHQNLCFYSSSQLSRFVHLLSQGSLRLVCEPRTLVLDIAGGASTNIFEKLDALLTEIAHESQTKKDESGRLVLESLRLRLNSHTHDDHQLVYDSLFKVDAGRFIWTGPDPPHHFSIAIISTAVPHLFKALASYTRLTHLHLTNIAFPDPYMDLDVGWTGIPSLPSLRFFYLGKATFLSADHVANFVLQCTGHLQEPACADKLERVCLVDVYERSIWGPRLRMPRLVSCARLLAQSVCPELSSSEVTDLFERVVHIDAETERLIGGDRAMAEIFYRGRLVYLQSPS
ncbi:hypothetical protein EV361DRAFT_902030 [Lentinula raphanica]|uniref:Uncharacterized protein n=1 Tax=Lentinula raphanica TaxID=153919 RepID=A0AA38PDG8_9AGAR|nr:hypothetical protein FB446DRAFT_728356 [Lentinula raphanica]KAJ3826157.1 hypothetical protein F5880DRAFT_1546880 [Lentinula raphanica]KAJ3840908.1 hypothetical protein F5878DRAFT_611771 [Lentinula raphanica]KAJ3973081.1 hypothetical protein EV361DRAFT_902030 [Lentinula raphanica]